MNNPELHHLLNRAIDGVVLHGESDRLRELVRELEADRERVQQAACRTAENLRHAVARAEQAEDAIERVLALHQPTSGLGYDCDEDDTPGSYGEIAQVCTSCGTADEYGVRWPCSTLAALDQPQQCPQCGYSGACNGGPCPLIALDQPQQPETNASVGRTPSCRCHSREGLTPQQHENDCPDALDQPPQTCVCGEPSTPATVHRTDGPCYIDQPQQPGCEHCGASVSHLPTTYMKGGTVGYCHGELTTEQQPTTVSPTAVLLATPCDACEHTLNWHSNHVGCRVPLCVCEQFQQPTTTEA